MLILEPYSPTGQALAVILQRAGWQVTLSQTARAALAALRRHSYDALLVDLDIATGDGWRVLQSLQLQTTTLPIIAMLGPESREHTRAQALGVRTVLPKPVDRKQLLKSTSTLLQDV
jgi:DNA-binding response OmpR family regulator